MQTAYPYVCVFLANSVTGEAEEAGEKFWWFTNSGLPRIQSDSIRSDDRSHVMYPNLLILQMRKLKSSEAK